MEMVASSLRMFTSTGTGLPVSGRSVQPRSEGDRELDGVVGEERADLLGGPVPPLGGVVGLE